MQVVPKARKNAAALLALRLATYEVASRAKDLVEDARWRRRAREARRRRLLRLGAVALVVVAAAAVVAAKIATSGRPADVPDEEPVTDEPVAAPPEPVAAP